MQLWLKEILSIQCVKRCEIKVETLQQYFLVNEEFVKKLLKSLSFKKVVENVERIKSENI